MKTILEYLSTIVKSSIIKATNETIRDIVKSEIDRLGFDADLNHINVSEVTNFSELFAAKEPGTTPNMKIKKLGKKYKNINPDVSKWNTENAKTFEGMFMNCRKFNCDLSRWDVHNVENMDYLFCECYEFNGDISTWNVSNVKRMQGIFSFAESFNCDISAWDVSNVSIMTYAFNRCLLFNQDLSDWNVSNVKAKTEMFTKCTSWPKNRRPKL